MVSAYLYVGLGGMLGAVLRFALLHLLPAASLLTPVLCINILGSFALGALVGAAEHIALPSGIRHFLMPGVLGGFTTFSAFAMEGVGLLEKQGVLSAALYITISVAGAVIAAAFGVYITKGYLP